MAEGGHSTDISADMEVVKRDEAFDALLQRNRSERLNELRQIEHDSRPVTGQNHRSNINHFLEKNIVVRENVEAAHASGKENVPLNSSNVEEHRPEAVVIEIQGLTQQQRVSNTLQTTAFRRHLENLIRGSISTLSQNRSPTPSHRPSPSPARAQSPAPARTHLPAPARAQIPVVESPPSGPVQERRDSVSSSSTSASSTSVDYNARINDPRGLLGSILNNSVPAPPPLPPTEHHGPVQPTPVTWNTVDDLQHENLVQEVSELVHRRLVSSTLEGEFRNVLEFHVRDRLVASGTDGQRVEEFVRSIPQSQPHIPNDFSNLGLPLPNDNWDNMSVTSISATAVPYTQTNLYMSREIRSLKSQLDEMKNMMKISFDLQLDIQRAIRQEVAAGIAAATGGSIQQVPEVIPSPSAIPKSKPVNDTHCLICLDNHSDSVMYQCGHMCVCYPCGKHLMDRGAKCPVCRAPIRDVIRCYKSNDE